MMQYMSAVNIRRSGTQLWLTSEGGTRAIPRTISDAATVRPLVLISSLRAGGAERVVVSLLCRLAQRGYRPALCALTSSYDSAQLVEEVREASVPHYDLGVQRLSDPRAAARYLRLLARAHINVVHAHGQDAWILASMARPFTNVPLALTRHVLDEPADTWRAALRRRSALAAARHADALVAPSFATADSLGQLAGFCPSRIHVIPNGIDLGRFDRPASTLARDEIRRALGFRTHEKVVLMPAVLRHGKGHDVLLDALPMIQSRVPHVRVVFAGDGERDADLRRLARSHGPEVVFLGHRSDLPELLAASDLVVLPSFAEALPTALIEASAASRPVVATRVGGIPDIVEHGVTGLLVPPGDRHALADAILTLLIDPGKAEAFGRAGRVIAHYRFSLDGHVDRTLELWSRMAVAGRRQS
jgi:glycosyltransferase involved in cell wall biosynthesis